MDPKKFIEPKEVEIGAYKFIISKIPAIPAQQVYRKIMQETKDDGDIAMTYITGDTAIELLSYAARPEGEEWFPLDSENNINYSCKSVDILIKLEAAMIRYNFGFLFDGTLQEVLEVLRDSEPVT